MLFFICIKILMEFTIKYIKIEKISIIAWEVKTRKYDMEFDAFTAGSKNN